MSGKRIECSEHALPGHPDKLCDAAVDAIVDFVRKGDGETAGDSDGQCGLEAAAIFGSMYVTGRIAARPELLARLDIPALVRRTYREAGYGEDAAGHIWGPVPGEIAVTTSLCLGDFAEGEREARHLSDDQAICVGYATDDERTDHLPPACWLARRIARRLFDLRLERGAGQVGPDGKVLATVETDGRAWRPLRVSISLNHHPGSDWLLLRRIAEEAVETACPGLSTPALLLNGAGMFCQGGPNGDNGLSGKKLVADAYGPTVPIGGGAWSGKDFHKVDRLGGMLARSLAKRAVLLGLGREAMVTLEYVPGCDRPAGISVVVDGHERGESLGGQLDFTAAENQAAWWRFVAWDGELPHLAKWGHQVKDAVWEAAGMPGTVHVAR